jgi:hypothetical protein
VSFQGPPAGVAVRRGIGSQGQMHYSTGTNTIHSGGEYESWLLLPIIPA